MEILQHNGGHLRIYECLSVIVSSLEVSETQIYHTVSTAYYFKQLICSRSIESNGLLVISNNWVNVVENLEFYWSKNIMIRKI